MKLFAFCVCVHRSRYRRLSDRKSLLAKILIHLEKYLPNEYVRFRLIFRINFVYARVEYCDTFLQHGGDATRKMRKLAIQAEAKRKMRMVGEVEIPRDSFIQLLKKYWSVYRPRNQIHDEATSDSSDIIFPPLELLLLLLLLIIFSFLKKDIISILELTFRNRLLDEQRNLIPIIFESFLVNVIRPLFKLG